MAGDFYNVLKESERIGGSVPTVAEFGPFAECLADCGLIDMCGRGQTFTWSNNTISSKIDRVLLNDQWLATFPDAKAEFCAEHLSDHTMSVVRVCQESHSRRQCFRFCNMWGDNRRFYHLFQQSHPRRQCFRF